jgi:triosephosphate isomerase (TIM)
MTIRPLVAGNWKMNGLGSSLTDVTKLVSGLGAAACDVLIAPPSTLVHRLAQVVAGSKVAVSGQDCHGQASGAYTGDVSAEMLRDAGATAIIVGHSERRANHGEGNGVVKAKADAAHRAGLIAIVCVGETIDERKSGQTLAVVLTQVTGSMPQASTAANTVVAYEPVWAIGTGLTPTAADVAQVHKAIRDALAASFGAEGAKMRILYGGSVKPSNAKELMSIADVNGALVGGASLKADDFLGIIAAYR